ncbi:MAG: HIT domain-containing protein [Planctomycetes bacterium]|nr:HIT domain-containing protein [Planctomycetota bacterium]
MKVDTACAFCSIVRGESNAVIVHSDLKTIAFMDKNPINPGHVLIIPRIHQVHIQDLDDDAYLGVMRTARRIAQAVACVYSPPKVGFAVAGFDISHAHLHVIPLHDYHDLTSRRYLERGELKRAGELGFKKAEESELQAQANQLKHLLSAP